MIFVNPTFTELKSFQSEREVRIAVMGEHVALAKGHDHLHVDLFLALKDRFHGDGAATYTAYRRGAGNVEIVPFTDFGFGDIPKYQDNQKAETVVDDLRVWMEY